MGWDSNDKCIPDCINMDGNCFKCLYWTIPSFGGFVGGLGLIFIIMSLYEILDNLEFAENSTEEQCTIESYAYTECSYQCDCSTTTDHCDLCSGFESTYYARAEDKCPDQILDNDHDYGNCNGHQPGTPDSYIIGQTYTCYVLPCEDGEFSFEDHASKQETWIDLLITGSIMFVIGCPICIYGTYLCRKKNSQS